MEVDCRAFFATLGSTAVIAAMPDEEKAEALEHYMTGSPISRPPVTSFWFGGTTLFGSQPNGLRNRTGGGAR